MLLYYVQSATLLITCMHSGYYIYEILQELIRQILLSIFTCTMYQ